MPAWVTEYRGRISALITAALAVLAQITGILEAVGSALSG